MKMSRVRVKGYYRDYCGVSREIDSIMSLDVLTKEIDEDLLGKIREWFENISVDDYGITSIEFLD